GRLFGVASQVSAEAESEPSAWQESLSALITEVKRAWQHGFTAQELDDAKSAFLSAAERAVQTEPTRDARSFIYRMNRALSSGEQPRAAAQALKLRQNLLPGITLQNVATTFTETFTPDAIAAIVQLPDKADLDVPSQDDVLTLVNTVWERPTTPWQGTQRPTALLDQAPTPGPIVERSQDEALKITHVTFANNVRLHYRYMDFKKDHVTVVITLAGGIIRETAANRGITSVATLPLSSPATARFSSTALRDFMTGKKVGVSMNRTADTVSFGYRAHRKHSKRVCNWPTCCCARPRSSRPAWTCGNANSCKTSKPAAPRSAPLPGMPPPSSSVATTRVNTS
ncbi:MAG: hypothetical protein OEU26_02745, partial [Candidatus Tectomicrobia bacterium]|nr:hypothetical protein [Candidatus Tectomicrobia bacterium]